MPIRSPAPYPPHVCPTYRCRESQADQLLKRSVAMQVQATYWGDQAIQYRYPRLTAPRFTENPENRICWMIYTRFPRMEEVLREYVLGVMPRKKQGHFRLYVPNAPYRTTFEEPSLVLLDGVPIFDMDKIIDFQPAENQTDRRDHKPLFHWPRRVSGGYQLHVLQGRYGWLSTKRQRIDAALRRAATTTGVLFTPL